MSPVSLNVSLALAGLTSILGVFIFIRLALEFRALRALHARPDLDPLLAELATMSSRVESYKGRDWFLGWYIRRLTQKRLWDASASPEFLSRLLEKARELNRSDVSASQLVFELESLADGEQSAL